MAMDNHYKNENENDSQNGLCSKKTPKLQNSSFLKF
jgi:hypothetical protein